MYNIDMKIPCLCNFDDFMIQASFAKLVKFNCRNNLYKYTQELMSRQRWRRSMKLGSMTIQITSRYLKNLYT